MTEIKKRYFYKKSGEVGSQGNTLYNVAVEYTEYNRVEILEWNLNLTRAHKAVKKLNGEK